MNRLTLFCFAAALWAAFSYPAFGQLVCPTGQPHTEATTKLRQMYRERSRAFGLQPDGAIVELTVSDDGATWSLLLVTPAGRACLITSGEHWTAHGTGEGA